MPSSNMPNKAENENKKKNIILMRANRQYEIYHHQVQSNPNWAIQFDTERAHACFMLSESMRSLLKNVLNYHSLARSNFTHVVQGLKILKTRIFILKKGFRDSHAAPSSAIVLYLFTSLPRYLIVRLIFVKKCLVGCHFQRHRKDRCLTPKRESSARKAYLTFEA